MTKPSMSTRCVEAKIPAPFPCLADSACSHLLKSSTWSKRWKSILRLARKTRQEMKDCTATGFGVPDGSSLRRMCMECIWLWTLAQGNLITPGIFSFGTQKLPSMRQSLPALSILLNWVWRGTTNQTIYPRGVVVGADGTLYVISGKVIVLTPDGTYLGEIDNLNNSYKATLLDNDGTLTLYVAEYDEDIISIWEGSYVVS